MSSIITLKFFSTITFSLQNIPRSLSIIKPRSCCDALKAIQMSWDSEGWNNWNFTNFAKTQSFAISCPFYSTKVHLWLQQLVGHFLKIVQALSYLRNILHFFKILRDPLLPQDSLPECLSLRDSLKWDIFSKNQNDLSLDENRTWKCLLPFHSFIHLCLFNNASYELNHHTTS